MADEVSNKTLAALLAVAIVVSLGGTLLSLNKLGSNSLTGAAEAQGTAIFNITTDITITLTNATVNFGEGVLNSSNSTCTLSTEDTSVPDCWVNSTDYAPAPFVIRHDGNNNVNLTINSTGGAGFFIGGEGAAYKFKGNETAIEGGDACAAAGTLQDSWTDVTALEQNLCSSFYSENDKDEIQVDIQITIPDGVHGEKSSTVTFTSYAV